MYNMKSLILVVPVLFAVGEVPVPELQILSQIGALGVLSWFCFSQDRELKEIRRVHSEVIDKLCDRWDVWEQQRQQGAENADETLRMLVAQCERRGRGIEEKLGTRDK